MSDSSHVRVGIVGAGWMGTLRARTLEGVGAHLVGVADRNMERAKQLSPDRAFATVDELLSAGQPDAIIVATSEAAHREVAVKALERGVHVLVEKPMATSIEDCDAMIEARVRSSATLMVGHTLRFDARYALAAEQVQSGSIGQPIHASSRRNNIFQVPHRLHVLCSVLQFLAIHEFDWLLWALADTPTHVFAAAARKRLSVDDVVITTIRFAKGAVAVVETSWVMPDEMPVRLEAEARVVGTKGAVYVEGSPKGLLLVTEKSAHLDHVYTASPFGRMVGATADETRHFIRCAQGEAQPLANGEAGRAAVAVMVAAQRSLDENCEVPV